MEYAWKLFLGQGRRCALTGLVLELSPSKMNKGASTASLDRIDSAKGYIAGNVQWVHIVINMMKQTLSDEEFVLWCHRVATYCVPPRELHQVRV